MTNEFIEGCPDCGEDTVEVWDLDSPEPNRCWKCGWRG